jgi:predicted dehydrogenase
MGDLGAHTFDAPVWALDLDMPTKVQATTSPFNEHYLPQSESITYEFESKETKSPIKITWSDGGIKPSRPDSLENGRQLQEALYIGSEGMIMHGSHGALPELIPEEPGFEVEKWLPRPNSVYIDFIEAIKENRKASNNFEVASKVTEIMLLTNVAVLSQQLDITLEYDSKNMKIKNLEEANQFFHYNYREGWKL